ncbi:MAG: hypothetical protein GWO24_24810, partial [Akkermansiaceae bacterium]|nr:hypothetical protein [Akkermansiaceae bacterium]
LSEAGKQIEQTLREGTLEEFLTYLHRGDDLGDAERRAAYRYLGEFWSKLHEDKNAAADGE